MSTTATAYMKISRKQFIIFHWVHACAPQQVYFGVFRVTCADPRKKQLKFRHWLSKIIITSL